jgi:hypothetical protein
MTTIPDIKSTYKTWFTWASLTPAQQAFATSQGYSSGSVSVAIGDVVDYVTQTVASTQTLLVDANGDPVCNYGFNGVADILLDTTGNVAYVIGGKLRVPGAKLEIASVYTTPFVQNVPFPTGFTDSANLISTSITNTTTKNRLYYLSLYGIEFATSCLQGQIGHTLKVTGAVTYTVVSATKGNAGTAGNCDNVQTLYQPLVLTPGQSITINCAYHWQNASAGAPTLTFNGARLELTVTSHGMEN